MPLFEYECRSCHEVFEELVRSPDEAVSCPACDGADVHRRLPLVRRAGSGGSEASVGAPAHAHGGGGGGCGSCAGGHCGSCGH